MSKNWFVAIFLLAFLSGSTFFLVKTAHKLGDIASAVSAEQMAQIQPAAGDKRDSADRVMPAPAPAPAPAASSEADKHTSLLAAPAASAIDVDAAMKDRILGDEKAPVTIVEYASLTCPHCAHFETEIFPELKKRLIDTGKVKFIYRDFPLDQYALKAAMAARCLPADKYYNMLEVLFSNQERWVKDKDPLQGLAQLTSLAGLDADSFKSCTQNSALENAIGTGMQGAQTKYKISSTPTFIFNDGADQLSGAQPVEKFEEIVTKLSKGK